MSVCVGLIREQSRRAVEDRRFASGELLRRRAQTDDGGKSERARKNGDVRRPGARIGGDAGDRLAVELHRKTGRQVVSDEDRVRAFGKVDRIVVGELEEQREDADLDVFEIADALTEYSLRCAREPLAPLEHHDLERLFRAEVLPNELFDGAGKLDVVEHGALHVEDRGFLGARGSFNALAHLAQTLFGLGEHGAEPRDLTGDGVIGNDAVADLGNLPAQEMNGSNRDTR